MAPRGLGYVSPCNSKHHAVAEGSPAVVELLATAGVGIMNIVMRMIEVIIKMIIII